MGCDAFYLFMREQLRGHLRDLLLQPLGLVHVRGPQFGPQGVHSPLVPHPQHRGGV